MEAAYEADIAVIDAVEFVDTIALPELSAGRDKIESVTLHPACSSVHLGLDAVLTNVASAAAHPVVVPHGWGCCAFAGDRGMLHPELNAAVAAGEAAGALVADT